MDDDFVPVAWKKDLGDYYLTLIQHPNGTFTANVRRGVDAPVKDDEEEILTSKEQGLAWLAARLDGMREEDGTR